jgi:hypothetical protein
MIPTPTWCYVREISTSSGFDDDLIENNQTTYPNARSGRDHSISGILPSCCAVRSPSANWVYWYIFTIGTFHSPRDAARFDIDRFIASLRTATASNEQMTLSLIDQSILRFR